jgi:hypothetical protein
LVGWHKLQGDRFDLDLSPNEVVAERHVFGLEVGVVGLVVGESNCTFFVFMDGSWTRDLDIEDLLQDSFDPHNFFGDIAKGFILSFGGLQ